MTILEIELLKIIGKFPTYMRPPYFSWSSLTLETLGRMGYKVIRGDIDTLDWKYDMDKSLKLFERGLQAGGSITLMHEHQKTIEELVPEVIRVVQESGKRGMFEFPLLVRFTDIMTSCYGRGVSRRCEGELV